MGALSVALRLGCVRWDEAFHGLVRPRKTLWITGRACSRLGVVRVSFLLRWPAAALRAEGDYRG
jgi:hypothetical protein